MAPLVPTSHPFLRRVPVPRAQRCALGPKFAPGPALDPGRPLTTHAEAPASTAPPSSPGSPRAPASRPLRSGPSAAPGRPPARPPTCSQAPRLESCLPEPPLAGSGRGRPFSSQSLLSSPLLSPSQPSSPLPSPPQALTSSPLFSPLLSFDILKQCLSEEMWFLGSNLSSSFELSLRLHYPT